LVLLDYLELLELLDYLEVLGLQGSQGWLESLKFLDCQMSSTTGSPLSDLDGTNQPIIPLDALCKVTSTDSSPWRISTPLLMLLILVILVILLMLLMLLKLLKLSLPVRIGVSRLVGPVGIVGCL